MTVKSRYLLGSLLLSCVMGVPLACSSASPEASVGRAQSAISGGQPDAKDSNVFLFVSHRGAAGVALCSASLIAPNLLLTARHCVSSVTDEQVTCGQTTASAPFAANTFYAENPETDDTKVTSFYTVSSVSVPTDGADICGFDIALVTLSSLVPSTVATPLVPRIDHPVSAGELYTAVGYGQASPSDAGTAGERRLRAGLKVSCAPGSCGKGVEANEFVGDAGICSGDSGGPALDSSGKVVGVVSRSADDCARPVYGSIAAWKDWLVGVAQQAATQGGYTAPFWVTSGLSDPSLGTDAGSSAGTGGEADAALGAQGAKCTGPGDCQSGFGCYSPNSVDNGYCAAFCSNQSGCASGTTCQAGVNVCVANPKSDSGSSSCAVSRAGKNAGSGTGALLALLGLALASASRRKRASRPR